MQNDKKQQIKKLDREYEIDEYIDSLSKEDCYDILLGLITGKDSDAYLEFDRRLSNENKNKEKCKMICMDARTSGL